LHNKFTGIGQKFAMLEMKSLITKVLRHFELEVGRNFVPTLAAELILRPTNGIRLRIKRRTNF
jgi:cytochrome P450 family 4